MVEFRLEDYRALMGVSAATEVAALALRKDSETRESLTRIAAEYELVAVQLASAQNDLTKFRQLV